MKRVLFIGTTFYNFREEKKLLHLRKKFKGLSQGMKIFVLARGKPFHKKIWNSDFYLLPQRFFWALAFPFSFYLCFIKKIDTIVAQSPLLEGFLGIVLKKILKKELIIETHGDWIEGTFLSKKRKFEFLEKRIVPLLARFNLRRTDKIRVVSQWLLRKAREIAPYKKYFLFPAFTDLELFLKEKNINFKNFILFVGNLEKVKGVEYLIKAFRKVYNANEKRNVSATNNNANSINEIKLVIVGDGSERKNLESVVSNSKSQISSFKSKIKFKGYLSLEETRNVMKDCYCLVLPSLSEGLGRVILEAMALGKPVIGSNVGGIPDLIRDGENGFLVEPKNVEELAEKIRVLLNNKQLAIEMGEKGREFIEKNFSNEKYIENYIKMVNL